MKFTKYEGLGNDFLVIETSDESAVPPERAAQLCDRRFGVGGDGVLLVLPSRSPEMAARMRVINADGSVPEMCGNGVRCVALHLARARGMREGTVRIDTDAGERACVVEDAAGEGMVTVDMGLVRVLGERTLDVAGRHVSLLAADAGNPHAILLAPPQPQPQPQRAFTRGDVEELGPRIATHPDFPRGTNVEFARVESDGIDLIVWERGCGITLACGTGACATVAVACDRGLVARGRPIGVRLPGGRLEVTIDDAGRATMRGPARRVFAGEIG